MTLNVGDRTCSRKWRIGDAKERWDTNITDKVTRRRTAPTPYMPCLILVQSSLRPHCLTRERLRLWKPISGCSTQNEQGQLVNLAITDLQRIQDILIHAWADSTLESYGSGLLVYHVFCDTKFIPETQRAPASAILISSFLAMIAGSYAGKTIANYLYGVRAWHILHGVPWVLNEPEIDALLKAATNVAPSSSKQKQRLPFTVNFMATIRDHLDLDVPLDAAVYSCLTTTFYTAAKTGEFTVRTLTSFDPALHVKPSDMRKQQDRNGLEVTTFHLPYTKSSANGEDVFYARQDGITDPEEAWLKHNMTNQPLRDGPLFAYRHRDGHKALTKTKLISRLAIAAKSAGLDPLQGHGIRIGATLEYLLRGVPFDVMKVIGRWASDAFVLYLRKHAQIMAPYLQAMSQVHDAFIRYTMPPVR
jgi:hypothetical protein